MDDLSIISLIVALLGLIVASLALIISHRSARRANLLTEHDLSLAAYGKAVDSLLSLKQAFAGSPDVFIAQMRQQGYEEVIPDNMRDDPATFLLFAGGMWKLSFVFSVMTRWKEFGWTENEKTGLEKELKLWLSLPGFHQVYRFHTKELQAHNPDFLTFLEELYQNRPCDNEVMAVEPTTP